MKVIVYFETPKHSHAEVVAQFASEELYEACLPVLETLAERDGWVITESVREHEQVTDKEDEPTSDIEATITEDGVGVFPWRVKLYKDGDMIDVEPFRTREQAEKFINLWGYTYKEQA